MGFRFFKRFGGKTGWGLNVSSSGLSSSYRTKYGSFGSKGFSIRTGIPGLSFWSSWGRGGSRGNAALIFLVVIIALYLLYFAALAAYNILLFLVWIVTELYKLVMRTFYRWKETQALKSEAQKREPNENSV